MNPENEKSKQSTKAKSKVAIEPILWRVAEGLLFGAAFAVGGMLASGLRSMVKGSRQGDIVADVGSSVIPMKTSRTANG